MTKKISMEQQMEFLEFFANYDKDAVFYSLLDSSRLIVKTSLVSNRVFDVLNELNLHATIFPEDAYSIKMYISNFKSY